MPKSDISPGIIHEWIQQNRFSDVISFLQENEPKDKSEFVDNLSPDSKQTPLAEACKIGNVELVEALLKCGADVSKGGLRTRKTVLDYAQDKPDIIAKILTQ
ncbi:ankyrin repeat domain-containing protein [Legionella gresilensis]|uniref:ankyrin repeat domain-containing protein n=1 Tax=Legionella gresilensis TaxID=91823 RepID=UPI001040FA89|nr:ankyrin repeat domain-containing protein [Legionella gresilensis]